MNVIETNNAIVSAEICAQIAELEAQAKVLEDKRKAVKNEILRLMEENGVIKIDNEVLTITYVASTDRETLDTKTLKEELPEVYDAYIKISKVAPSLRIKIK